MENISIDNNNSRFSVVFISPYRDLAEQFTSIAEKDNIKIYVEVASLHYIANIVDKLKDKFDNILKNLLISNV